MYTYFRGLSDVNGDGQMDFNEFSIACKLITNKLKGLELPKTLPPSMLTAFGGMQPNPMMQQAGMMRGGKTEIKIFKHSMHLSLSLLNIFFPPFNVIKLLFKNSFRGAIFDWKSR